MFHILSMVFLRTEPHTINITIRDSNVQNQEVLLECFYGMLWLQISLLFVQGPPGPAGLQGPIGAPGPAVSTSILNDERTEWTECECDE